MDTHMLQLPAIALCLLLATACGGEADPAATEGLSPPAPATDTGTGGEPTSPPTGAGEAYDLTRLGDCASFPIADLEAAVGAAPLDIRDGSATDPEALACDWTVAAADNTTEPGVVTSVSLYVSSPQTEIFGDAPLSPSDWLADRRDNLVRVNGVPESELADVADFGEAALFCCNSGSEEFGFHEGLEFYLGQRGWDVWVSKTDPNGEKLLVDRAVFEAAARVILAHAESA